MTAKTFARLVVATAMALGALAAPALAAPARTTELAADGTAFTWSDGPRNALGTNYTEPPLMDMCDPRGWPCDETLIHVTQPGRLTLTAGAEGLIRPDVDIYLYSSDADGTEGDLWDFSETPEAQEILIDDLDAGWYLFRVAYFSGLNVTYDGSAALTPIPVQ